MRHTVIPVMHRDASNYKIHGVLVATGAITDAEAEELERSLDSGTYYLPLQLGLDFFGTDWASYGSYDDDHPWHEMLVAEITVTEDGDDSWFSGAHVEHVGPISDFVRRVSAAAAAGWDENRYAPADS